jgi:hypothetical protein
MWCLVRVDDDEVDHFQRCQIEGSQLLRNERPEVGFDDMRISRQTGDKNVAFALGVEKMPHVSGMDDVERSMTHDDFLHARRRAEKGRDFRRGLQFVADELAT